MRLYLLFALLLFVSCGGETDPVPGEGAQPDPLPSVAPSPLRFTDYGYADSVALRKRGPYYVYDLTTLRAADGAEELRRLINDTLAAAILGFAPAAGIPLDTAVRAYLAPRFDEYREQDVQEEWLQEAPASFRREEFIRTELLYRTDSLIVLANHYYEYTGGAHGMHYTQLLPFSVYPPRRLTFEDLFREGAEAPLRDLLTREAMRDPDRVFGDSIPVTRNVAPLADGVRFLYDPYAIGPYASGEIALDLPYSELRGLLRSGPDRRWK